MDHLALLPAAERATVFREAAARLRVGSATIIEKDFWVCWTLQKIFSNAALPGPLFKGGTSLSKVYKVIERFSEDVDIVLDRHTLGFVGEQDPPNIAGTNKRNRKLDELVGKCSETVQGTVHNELRNSFRSVLGEADWKISEDPADADRQSILFAYPLGQRRTSTAWVATFVPWFDWSSDAAGMCGPLIASRSSRMSLICCRASWPSRSPKSTFFALNAPCGKRPRCSMPSSIRARCRHGSRGTTTTWLVCIGMSSGSLQ